MTRAAPKSPTSGKPGKDYHHGDLRRAILDAAVGLIEESGPEGVTMRETARRAGVSSAAPFRHFSSKTALMTAIAEEGIGQLRGFITEELQACASDHPLPLLMAFAEAYVRWFTSHPVHYRVVADRPRIDFDASDVLTGGTAWIRREMSLIYDRADEMGLFSSRDPQAIHFQMRALSYGLGRMQVDDHLREWGVSEKQAAREILNVLRENLIAHCADPDAARSLLEGPDRV